MEFTFRGVKCVVFYEEDKKEFYVAVYKKPDSLFATQLVGLFQVERFSKSQLMTAYQVANRHVLDCIV